MRAYSSPTASRFCRARSCGRGACSWPRWRLQLLLTFIDGGAERLAGEADTISGVVAETMPHVTGTLDAPYSNFDAVAGSSCSCQCLPPSMTSPTRRLGERDHDRQRPFVMEEARTDEEIASAQ